MTALAARLSAVRRSQDEGSALAMALVFLMIFGLYVGTVLQFATTGQRTTSTVREEATSTYAAGGAVDGAINAIRGTTGTGVDPGTASPPAASTCFTLPSGALDNATPITASCQPRTGSGGDSTAALASQPAQAVLARSTNATEGLSLGSSSTLTARGRVLVNRRLTVPGPGPGAATLRSFGPQSSVQAGDCTTATGTVTPSCATAAVPGDPGWAVPAAYPAMGRTVPACTAQNRVVTLSPGTYLSGATLQTALNCGGGRVIWFTPGTYYLDFRDAAAANRELRVPNGAVVVGGEPLGWVPGTTVPGSVPVPTAASPTQSACDVGRRGVQFVFGGDSRMNVVPGADIQLCAEETGPADQHVVLRGLASQTAPLPAAQPTAGAATVSADMGGPGAAWAQPTEGAVVDATQGNGTVDLNNLAFATAARNSTTRALRVGPFPTGLVPPEATNVSVTVSLTGGMIGPGSTSVRLTNGTTPLTTNLLRTCPPAGCNDTALRTDSVTITEAGLTAAVANSMYVEVLVSSRDVAAPNGGATTGAVDGITVSVDFAAPMRPTSGTGVGAPYVTGQASTTPILRTAGSHGGTIVALHGTVDAQLAAVDLGVTGVPYTVVDRGLAVRHLRSTMTLAAGYTGPLVSVPDLAQGPREVLVVARDASNVVLARAHVTFGNAAGAAATVNGTVPTVNEWSVS